MNASPSTVLTALIFVTSLLGVIALSAWIGWCIRDAQAEREQRIQRITSKARLKRALRVVGS